MIKNLNIIVALDGKGKIKLLHGGNDRGKAQTAFEKAASDPENECVLHVRNPKFERRKFPAKALRYREERKNAAQEMESAQEPEEENEDPALETDGPEDPPTE
jgi:UDP-N-acetylmuramoylalanine-D-glutamate ligase